MASGALDVWGGTTFMLAAQRGQLVTISVIAALYPAITVLLARIFLKERLERHQVVGLFGAGWQSCYSQVPRFSGFLTRNADSCLLADWIQSCYFGNNQNFALGTGNHHGRTTTSI